MKKKEYLIFVAPSVIIMTALAIIPLIVTVYLSFFKFTYGGTPHFIGITNYFEVFTSSRFWESINFTLIITIITTGVKLLIGFALAYMLTKVRSKIMKSIFVAGFMIPFIVPPVVGTLVYSWLFKDNLGFYTYLLSLINVNIDWFATEWATRLLVVNHWIWHGVAFSFIIFFAGLQSMSKEPLEAATVDGANSFQKIKHVVLPQLNSLIVFAAMVDIMDAYRMFDNIAVMTKGGPGSSTETLMWYNYSVAMGELDLGKGSAISILTVIGILILMLPFLRQTYKEQFEGQFNRKKRRKRKKLIEKKKVKANEQVIAYAREESKKI